MYFALVGTWLKAGETPAGSAELSAPDTAFYDARCPNPGFRCRSGRPCQSAVIPASLTTLAHSATSALMMSANWPSGALLASQPATSSFSRTSAVASAASSALLMRATTGCGVPAGTTTPHHGV